MKTWTEHARSLFPAGDCLLLFTRESLGGSALSRGVGLVLLLGHPAPVLPPPRPEGLRPQSFTMPRPGPSDRSRPSAPEPFRLSFRTRSAPGRARPAHSRRSRDAPRRFYRRRSTRAFRHQDETRRLDDDDDDDDGGGPRTRRLPSGPCGLLRWGGGAFFFFL